MGEIYIKCRKLIIVHLLIKACNTYYVYRKVCITKVCTHELLYTVVIVIILEYIKSIYSSNNSF